MTTNQYILQTLLILVTLVALPLSLTKKSLPRKWRAIIALCPIALGLIAHLLYREAGGIFAALMGLWALFFITIHPDKKPEDEE